MYIVSDNSIIIYNANGIDRVLLRLNDNILDMPAWDATAFTATLAQHSTALAALGASGGGGSSGGNSTTLLPAEGTGRAVVGILGQSNSRGWAEGIDQVLDYPDPRVLQFPGFGSYVGKEIVATEPLFHVNQFGDGIQRIGYGVAFGRELAQYSSKKVLLVPCAEPGTGFSDNRWNPGNDLFTNAVTKLNQAIALDPNNKLVAILWHQGEQDVSLTKANYISKLDGMLVALRAQVTGAANVPFIAGQLVPSWVASSTSDRQKIQDAITELPTRQANTGVVLTTGLTAQSDGIHFDATSQRKLGKLYFAKLLSVLSGTSGSSSGGSGSTGGTGGSGTSGGTTAPTGGTLPSGFPTPLWRITFENGYIDAVNNLTVVNSFTSIITDTVRGKVVDFPTTGGSDLTVATSVPSTYSKSIWAKIRNPNNMSNGNLISSNLSPFNTFWFPGTDLKVTLGHETNFTALQYNTPLSPGVWYHLVATFDNTSKTARIFVNGLKVAEAVLSATYAGSGNLTKIGTFSDNGDNFDGQLDNPTVWNIALTEAQVLALYNSESV